MSNTLPRNQGDHPIYGIALFLVAMFLLLSFVSSDPWRKTAFFYVSISIAALGFYTIRVFQHVVQAKRNLIHRKIEEIKKRKALMGRGQRISITPEEIEVVKIPYLKGLVSPVFIGVIILLSAEVLYPGVNIASIMARRQMIVSGAPLALFPFLFYFYGLWELNQLRKRVQRKGVRVLLEYDQRTNEGAAGARED